MGRRCAPYAATAGLLGYLPQRGSLGFAIAVREAREWLEQASERFA